jgi:hypothetical protein
MDTAIAGDAVVSRMAADLAGVAARPGPGGMMRAVAALPGAGAGPADAPCLLRFGLEMSRP